MPDDGGMNLWNIAIDDIYYYIGVDFHPTIEIPKSDSIHVYRETKC